MDDALKTRGIIYLNVETWLLFSPPYQNLWLRAWADTMQKAIRLKSNQLSVEFKIGLNQNTIAIIKACLVHTRESIYSHLRKVVVVKKARDSKNQKNYKVKNYEEQFYRKNGMCTRKNKNKKYIKTTT